MELQTHLIFHSVALTMMLELFLSILYMGVRENSRGRNLWVSIHVTACSACLQASQSTSLILRSVLLTGSRGGNNGGRPKIREGFNMDHCHQEVNTGPVELPRDPVRPGCLPWRSSVTAPSTPSAQTGLVCWLYHQVGYSKSFVPHSRKEMSVIWRLTDTFYVRVDYKPCSDLTQIIQWWHDSIRNQVTF